MSDRKDHNPFGRSLEHDVIRKVAHRQLADVGIVDTKDGTARARKMLDKLDHPKDFAQKARRYVGIALPVPLGGSLELSFCSSPESNRLHRDNTLVRISSNAIRQSSSSSGFVAASAARRWISAAHASATSSSRSSRLASSSAAILARSLS